MTKTIFLHQSIHLCHKLNKHKYNNKHSNAAFAKLGIKRLCLHAAEVRFPHPVSGKTVQIKADYDAGFSQALKSLAQAG